MLILETAIILAKIAVVIGVVLFLVSYTVLAERKVSAMIQERVGPNRVGIPFLGNFGGALALAQPVADALKLMLKEQFTPGHANKFYYWLAPALAMAPALIALAFLPFGSVIDLGWIWALLPEAARTWLTEFVGGPLPQSTRGVIADGNVGILMVFAITSLGVYGIVLAGWASNSKYPFLGGIRSSAQLISYELAMGLSVIPVFLVIGNLNLSAVVTHQMQHGWLVLPFFAEQLDWKSFVYAAPCALSFVIFTVAAFAETNRLPFDLPESETELVGGYNTEYAAMKFALFFLGEYAAMIVASALMVTLFLGGWSLPGIGFKLVPGGEGNFLWGMANAGVFLGKIVCFLLFFIWIRWTVPRFRYDQLMNLGWKVFLPLALANVVFTAILVGIVR